MKKSAVTIAYLSQLTGVSSKTIAGYVKLLRSLLVQQEDQLS